MDPELQLQDFAQYSNYTAYPGDIEAAYEYYLDDPMITNLPIIQEDRDWRFGHNLALYLNDSELTTIGTHLKDQIDRDIQDREQWINIIAQAIDYLGVGGQKTKTSLAARNADGYSSTFMTIALRITSKLHASLFPSKDMIDTMIRGIQTPDMVERAYRIKEFFNYFVNDIAEEYIPDKKQALFWMVLTGSVFSKVFFDKVKERPSAPYIRAENLIINSTASSLDDAERITYQFTLTERQYLQQVEAKEYRYTHLEEADRNDNKIQNKIDNKLGINPQPNDEDKIYEFHECLCYLDLPGFEHLDESGKPTGKLLPYIVTKDKNSSNIVSIYRNWDENDPKYKPKNYYVQYKYFTGFNIYGLGLAHLLLGNAKAETELQQQLLKAAQLANAPVLLMAPGTRFEKTQLDIKAGAINQFNSFGADFNNNMKPLGFHDPSGVMLQLKDMLKQGMEDLSVARQISPDNIPTNTSATTMLGILSTMHILEDSLMNDLYLSFKKELAMLYNLFGQYLPDEPYPFAVEGGEHAIMRNDFMPAIGIRPSLDPNVSSSTFQLIINEAINGLQQQAPDLYNQKEIHLRMLRAMKVADPESLFKPDNPQEDPPPLDPISEGKAAMMGQPIKAYKYQDQSAYIAIHQANVAQLQADQSQDHSQAISILQSNIQQREALRYMIDMEAKIGHPLPEDPSQISPEDQNHIAMIAAQKVQQEQAEMQKHNPPPVDPATVFHEENRIKEKEIEIKAQQEEQRISVDNQKIAHEMEIQQLKTQVELERVQLEREKLEFERQKAQMEYQAKMSQLEENKRKADLDAEGRAFDSTLKYEKDLQNKEMAHDNGTINQSIEPQF